MGPGRGPGPALLHGPRPGPDLGPGPWAPAHGPGPLGPGPALVHGPGPAGWLAGQPKKKVKVFSGAQQEIPEEFPNGLRVKYPLPH